jgi:tetratricopeptide (TPR) repeat protein
MEQIGHSGPEITGRLITGIAQITDLDTEFHQEHARDITGESFLEALAEALQLEHFVVAARRTPGIIEIEFKPEFVEREGKTILRLNMFRPRTGVRMVQEFEAEGEVFEPTLLQATRVILGIIDPIALAIHDMRQGDHLAARQSLERAARAVPEEQRHVTDTLQGLLLLEEGDPEAAAAEFRYALIRKADFAPARLALAIAAIRRAGAGEAIRILDGLKEPGRSWSDRARREVPAAAAFIRGRLAAGEGQWNEALVQFRAATEAVPNFADAHRGLAETYNALGMAPLAGYHARTAGRLSAPDVPRIDEHIDNFLLLVTAATVPPVKPAPPPSGMGVIPDQAPKG